MKSLTTSLLAIGVAASIALVGCGSPEAEGRPSNAPAGNTSGTGTNAGLSGNISIDGSTTVFAVMEGLASRDAFLKANPNVQISTAKAGTGAGMQKFSRGELDIAMASRPIKAEELKALADAKIEFVEVPIAIDALSIIVNRENTAVKSITIAELNKLWNKDSKITKWNEVNPAWPDAPVKLYGPTDAHGTYEYFNEVVNGDKGNTRTDYNSFGDYSPMVDAIKQDPNALGYIGHAYYEANKDSLNAVAVDAGKGAVMPSKENVANGTYVPLSRPLFLYVKKESLNQPQVKAFLTYILTEGQPLIEQLGYVPLPSDIATLALDRVNNGTVGTVFMDFQPGANLAEVMKPKAGA